MAQILIIGNSCQFILDNLFHLFLNAVIVGVLENPGGGDHVTRSAFDPL